MADPHGGRGQLSIRGDFSGQGDGYDMNFSGYSSRSAMSGRGGFAEPYPSTERYGGNSMSHGSLYNDSSSNMCQPGAVVMVYGLNMDRMNCEKLFNLFCLYGNVVRIKFLKSKEGSAMVQMCDPSACDKLIKNLTGTYCFGNKIQIGFSKQSYLQDPPNSHDLADGSPSFKDYFGNRNNRFSSAEQASKNRIQQPSRVLHYFNAPPNLTEEDVTNIFNELNVEAPVRVKIFPSKSERSSSGLCEWQEKSDAAEALILANHYHVENPGGKNPYVLKLCFSNSPIIQ